MYTPAAGYTGPDAFNDRVSDGSLSSNTATVSITVTTVNGPPTAANDTYTTPEDAPLNVPAKGVLANDSDPTSDLDGRPRRERGPRHARSELQRLCPPTLRPRTTPAPMPLRIAQTTAL